MSGLRLANTVRIDTTDTFSHNRSITTTVFVAIALNPYLSKLSKRANKGTSQNYLISPLFSKIFTPLFGVSTVCADSTYITVLSSCWLKVNEPVYFDLWLSPDQGFYDRRTMYIKTRTDFVSFTCLSKLLCLPAPCYEFPFNFSHFSAFVSLILGSVSSLELQCISRWDLDLEGA